MSVQTSALAFQAISPRLGAELIDVNLLELSDEGVRDLQQLAGERGVVVARDQVMTVDEHADFARRLGPVTLYPVKKEGMRPELIAIRADENSTSVPGEGWHSDISSDEATPSLSMLRMELTPESGGDTLFADMYHAFESLSKLMQDLLLKVSARHDPIGHYLYLSGAKRLDELPSQVHPAVRTHPLTGRKALFINEGFVRRIVELNDDESKAILRMLFDHVARGVDFQIRVQWKPNTVVFWDNRCVQHHAAWDYFPQRRRGYRATIVGEVPYLDN